VLLTLITGAAHDAPNAIFDGDWLIDVFFKAASITRENVLDLHNILQGIQQKFAAISHIANVNLLSIGQMQQVLQQAFDIGCRNDASQAVELLATDPQQHTYFKAFAQLLLNGGVSLSYWCFSPGVTIRAIVKDAKCIILASGTLAPLQSWESELRVPFPVRLEGAHVVARGRLWCGVFPTGPSGKKLDSSFNNRDNMEYLDELGALICNASKVVPHGVLAFFGSYSSLERAVGYWQRDRPAGAGHAPGQATVWSRLSRVKSIVVEPRDGRSLLQALDAYKAACDDSVAKKPGAMGGLFLGVCRGKASEGLNFSDHYGRAVIICGVPFPSSVDPRVKLKRQFLVEERCRSSDKSFAQSADDWCAPTAAFLYVCFVMGEVQVRAASGSSGKSSDWTRCSAY
jgi:Rad3-related DNA helicase